jgi:hypothetical protein
MGFISNPLARVLFDHQHKQKGMEGSSRIRESACYKQRPSTGHRIVRVSRGWARQMLARVGVLGCVRAKTPWSVRLICCATGYENPPSGIEFRISPGTPCVWLMARLTSTLFTKLPHE